VNQEEWRRQPIEFKRGYNAKSDGYGRGENPYRRASRAAADWSEGWQRAYEDRKR